MNATLVAPRGHVGAAPGPEREHAATRVDALWSDRLLTIAAAALFGFGLLTYLAVAIPQMHKPLMYDDVPFTIGALGAAENGRPYGYHGWMSDLGEYNSRDQWAIWHPPLYVYTLGLWIKLFGSGEIALRSLGLISGMLSAFLTYLLAGQLMRGTVGEKRLAGGLAAALTLTSPIYVQSVQILDIDFPLLLPLTLTFLVLYLRLEASARWYWLVPMFGVLLWAKLTNPLPLLASVVCWQLLRGQWRRALLHGAVIGVGGGALFAVTWVLAGTVVGWPLDQPFKVNQAQWKDSSDVAQRAYVSFGAFVGGLQPTIIWMGPPLVALGLMAAVVRAGLLVRDWRLRSVDLLLGFCALLVVGYVNKSAGWFPKYQVVLAPLLAAAAAPLLVVALRRRPWLAVLGLPALAVTALYVRRDVQDFWALSRRWQLDENTAGALLAIFLVIVITALLLRAWNAVPLVLAAMALGWGLGVGPVLANRAYSTHYWYGTSGVQEAAAWVDANVPPNTLYVATKEVSWLTSRPDWVDAESVLAVIEQGKPQFDAGRWQGVPIDTYVAWVREPHVQAVLDQALPEHGFRPTVRFGDIQVYQRTPES